MSITRVKVYTDLLMAFTSSWKLVFRDFLGKCFDQKQNYGTIFKITQKVAIKLFFIK